MVRIFWLISFYQAPYKVDILFFDVNVISINDVVQKHHWGIFVLPWIALSKVEFKVLCLVTRELISWDLGQKGESRHRVQNRASDQLRQHSSHLAQISTLADNHVSLILDPSLMCLSDVSSFIMLYELHRVSDYICRGQPQGTRNITFQVAWCLSISEIQVYLWNSNYSRGWLICLHLLILREFNLPVYLVLDISSLLKFVREQVWVHKGIAVLRWQVSATQTYQLWTSLVDGSAQVIRQLVCYLLRFHSKFWKFDNKIINSLAKLI